ncbi:hypothetical protein BCV70DRAFT_202960 [Testicularia cyperi]|uniref:RAVE complex protein Rav1 C-terminal domain-containing protein n=1 Tax=Testicularia cyperi TaxID=1882483 RepID=A0A317XIG9_9BASI|nr:hypothetical protein BCV70DRAFT_202960 [Testicularia cyperi]
MPTLRRSQVILGSSSSVLAGCSRQSAEAHGSSGWPALHTLDYLKGCDTRDGLTAQASFDQICILSRDQRFAQALPFWDAFSSSEDTERDISCVCVGTLTNTTGSEILVAAAMDHRIAIWSSSATTSTASSRRWKVHSTLMISDGPITCIHLVHGNLLVGSSCSLSLWRLENTDIPIWRRFWSKPTPVSVHLARLSPDASSFAATLQGGQHVLIWQYQPRSSRLPCYQQRLFHPYPIANLLWRQPPEPSSQADVLITYCSQGVARIWAPVIDEPTQLRLWSTVDAFGQNASSKSRAGRSRAFYLDPAVLCSALRCNIGVLQRELQMIELGLGDSVDLDAHARELETDIKHTRLRRLQQLSNETPDMFISLDSDGSLSVTAVANIDRRPPTLLQTFTVLRVPFAHPVAPEDVSSLVALPLHAPLGCSSDAPMLVIQIFSASGNSHAYSINPALFFDGRGLGIAREEQHPSSAPSVCSTEIVRPMQHQSRVRRLCRSADGNVLLSSAASESIVWRSASHLVKHTHQFLSVQAVQQPSRIDCISPDGLLTASLVADGSVVVNRPHDAASTTITPESSLDCALYLSFGVLNATTVLFAVLSTGQVYSWWIQQSGLVIARAQNSSWLSQELFSGQARLLLVDSIRGTSGKPQDELRLLTTTECGRIDLWSAGIKADEDLVWTRLGRLHNATGRIEAIRCSDTGLFAVVSSDAEGQHQLAIYDSKTTSFSSGERHMQVFGTDDRVVAIDWSPSEHSQTCLAVAFSHHVLILCAARTSILAAGMPKRAHGWSVAARVDLDTCTSSVIRAVSWISRERIALACASVLFVYGPAVQSHANVDSSNPAAKHLVEVAAELGGPVVQYHPSFLHQCALWHKTELAKAIIHNLHRAVNSCDAQDMLSTWQFDELPIERVLWDSSATNRNKLHVNGNARKDTKLRPNSNSIFDDEPASDHDDEDPLADNQIEQLLTKLKLIKPPHLSDGDLLALPVLVRTISDAERERRGMDENGVRYLLALRLMLNQSGSADRRWEEQAHTISYRDCVWAFHSENQEPLVSAIETAFRNRLNWPAARATGIFMWLKNAQTLRTQAEAVARAQFMTGEDRDPVKCSLLYFALGKRKVVQGLWKQAVWHPEQKKMLQFLSHDFDEERWKSAAQKNAFALLSQRRYEFAASFFMLGDSLRDAINVCVRNLGDLPLAIALARIKEGSDNGPVLSELLRTRLLPLAFETGDRWLGSWAFWMLKRRDLAVRMILTPLAELLADEAVGAMLSASTTCGNDNYDDPSLALLFQQLKTRSLQTLKGLADIPEKKEHDFVLHTNRLLQRMGCDAIGLSVLRNWQFEPPIIPTSTSSTLYPDLLSRADAALDEESKDVFTLDTLGAESGDRAPTSPTRLRRRTSQASISPPGSPRMARRRSSLLRRRSSIINDLDIGQLQIKDQTDVARASDSVAPKPADAVSQFLSNANGHSTDLSEEPAPLETKPETALPKAEPSEPSKEPVKKGISVFKSAAASNSQQGAQEFDFSSFGF